MKVSDHISIRWHSRAGQGAVTACNFLAEALNDLGWHSTSFPDFGAEKRGAPVLVFNRASRDKFDDNPAQPAHLGLVVLLEPSLVRAEISYDDVVAGLGDDGVLLINTTRTTPSKFAEKFSGETWHVPASKIANETVGRNVPNVPTVGAITKILGLDRDEIRGLLAENLAQHFRPDLVEKNMIGFDRGYDELFEPKK